MGLRLAAQPAHSVQPGLGGPRRQPVVRAQKLIYWDAGEKKWTGDDEPDFEVTKDPAYRAPDGAVGMDAIGGNQPFIMHPDGLAWMYAPGGTKDAPLPTHYEPVESPVRNQLYTGTQDNPTTRYFDDLKGNQLARFPQDEFPVVGCTFRLTEQYLSGPMSRFNSWLNELMPAMFIEISPELAAQHGIEHGGLDGLRVQAVGD